ncbi:hypothetical protein IAE16_01545 [Hydrogenobacter sp. T-2]|uniref:hypothetical protein n=1 Tax=Pampinifervens diazotrophicum TaxID=1632018 RepID=UPI002B25CE2B|nr:hypothetical protein [Hydrogenobacter sp. T-2]WPM32375.1 hypothetical protein IAE16_01545 [Hydrogenobacter sp. T-2]
MEDLKQLLLRCEIYLQQEDWDKLIETLSGIKEEHINNLDAQSAQECLRILEYLITQGEEVRNRLSEALVNIKRFRGGYGT